MNMAKDKALHQQQRREMMLNDPISRVIPKMAIPTIVAFLINSIYSLADTYFVSSLGTEATAAVSVNSSLDQLIMMAGSLLAIGANSYIARLLGQGNDKKASQVLSTAFFLAFGLGALVMVGGLTFMTPWCVCWALPPPASNIPLTMPPMCCLPHLLWPPALL